ncbi:PAS domain-containing protein [Vibrio vulnificus]|uniref:PAS domain-containing protein n=1 Tax=Vibrio vulnificus TaxID=672 RepID=UPI0013053BBD|nr:PAS domain-containing protein [Vibrio vulnificus]
MTTNLMMADKNGIIRYLNPALENLLRSRESELQKSLPGFDSRNLVGKSIDVFHKNPAHQQAIISNPDRLPFSSDIKVGSLEFNLTCIAMRDGSGNYMGPALQWIDITEQRDGQSSGKLDSKSDCGAAQRAHRYLGLQRLYERVGRRH